MRMTLALAGAAAGLLAFSTAQAQDCVNGYRTIGAETIVKCDATMSGDFASGTAVAPEAGALPPEAQAAEAPVETFPEEPMTTGSIAPAAHSGGLPLEYREHPSMAAGAPEEPMYTGSIAPAAPVGNPPLEYRENTDMAGSSFQEPMTTGSIRPAAEEPVFTGSIQPPPQTAASLAEPGALPEGAEVSLSRERNEECTATGFYTQQLEEYDMPMPC